MSRYTYHLEAHHRGAWRRLHGEVSRGYGEGYLACMRSIAGPTLAYRLVRSDGRVIDETNGKEEATVGAVAGWPTWQQYASAAARALECSRRVHREAAPEEVGEMAERLRALVASREEG